MCRSRPEGAAGAVRRAPSSGRPVAQDRDAGEGGIVAVAVQHLEVVPDGAGGDQAVDRRAHRQSDPAGTAGSEGSSVGGLTELMRRVFAAGFSGFFVTEEALRKALGETLPKDWADFASEQSARTRNEVIERLSYEVGRAVETVDWAAVLSTLLEGRTLEVRAEIRLGEKSGDGGKRFVVDVARRDED